MNRGRRASRDKSGLLCLGWSCGSSGGVGESKMYWTSVRRRAAVRLEYTGESAVGGWAPRKIFAVGYMYHNVAVYERVKGATTNAHLLDRHCKMY